MVVEVTGPELEVACGEGSHYLLKDESFSEGCWVKSAHGLNCFVDGLLCSLLGWDCGELANLQI